MQINKGARTQNKHEKNLCLEENHALFLPNKCVSRGEEIGDVRFCVCIYGYASFYIFCYPNHERRKTREFQTQRFNT